MTKEELIAFEKEVAARYEAGEIKAPVHLSGGNEDQLIEIFKDIKRTDLVLSTWRSHYHALLHGIEPQEVMRQILAGKSMSINSIDPWFYASSIAGGILPIAVGLGAGIARSGGPQHVWCFVGDMAAHMGIFAESTRYAHNFELPVTFVVEDNLKSVQTTTKEVWNTTTWAIFRKLPPNAVWYLYGLTWPHHGTGKWIPF